MPVISRMSSTFLKWEALTELVLRKISPGVEGSEGVPQDTSHLLNMHLEELYFSGNTGL